MSQSKMYIGLYYRNRYCGIKERRIDHNKRDENSHILKHPREDDHTKYGTRISKYWVIILARFSNGRLVKLYS